MTYYTYIDTPAGTLLLIGDGIVVSGIHWKVFKRAPIVQLEWVEDHSVFANVIRQLDAYFAGERRVFNVAFSLHGTAFQEQVWSELLKIPFGVHSSYQMIATSIGRPKAVRAVGTAVGSNPISIIVPCHRVLTSDNKLGGYAGGLSSKQCLLEREEVAWR